MRAPAVRGRTPVGYEALTRFADGTRPDLRFAQVSGVGMGTELELATLKTAIERHVHYRPAG